MRLKKRMAGLALLLSAGAGLVPLTVSTSAQAATPAKSVPYVYQKQPNDYFCAPAAVRIVLSAAGKTPSQYELAKDLGTTGNGTNSANDTTRVLNKHVGGYHTVMIPNNKATPAQVDRLKTDVMHTVNSGHVVVVNIAGSVTDTQGNFHSYEGGHYLNVVGYEDGGMTAVIADAATPETPKYELPLTDLADWTATRGYSAA